MAVSDHTIWVSKISSNVEPDAQAFRRLVRHNAQPGLRRPLYTIAGGSPVWILKMVIGSEGGKVGRVSHVEVKGSRLT